MMVPVTANPTRNGQLRLNSLLKNTGHGSNFLIVSLCVYNRSAAVLRCKLGEIIGQFGNKIVKYHGFGLSFLDLLGSTFGFRSYSPTLCKIPYIKVDMVKNRFQIGPDRKKIGPVKLI